jgi:molecular chaperone DnaK
VLARDTKTGQDKIVEINSAVDVSDEAVEAMISESLDHAFDDMSERVWTEAKLKAEEMLNAVEAAFAQVGDAIDAREKETIQQAAVNVQDALGANDTRKLQAANSALDEATQGLAAALVEKAMQTAR